MAKRLAEGMGFWKELVQPLRGNGRDFGFVVVMLQREQQRQVGVAVEGTLVSAGSDWAKAPDEPVVGEIVKERGQFLRMVTSEAATPDRPGNHQSRR